MSEINKRIHEEIFGGCIHDWKTGRTTDTQISFRKCVKCDVFNAPDIPDYSGNISAAFKVVEEMEKRGFVWTFSNNGNQYAPKYDVRFFLVEKGLRVIEIAETLPMAIC